MQCLTHESNLTDMFFLIFAIVIFQIKTVLFCFFLIIIDNELKMYTFMQAIRK